tara:strand:- start:165 stop:548 length:384 start_codon:yes stop_codon:yes gene_type:complete
MKERNLFISALIVFGSMILSVQRVKAEDYLCSFELSNLNRKGEYEQRRYKRSGRQFEVKYANQKVIFEILKETNKFLILTNSFSNIHPEVMVTLIDKKTKEVYENYLHIKERGKPAYPSFGKCVLYN